MHMQIKVGSWEQLYFNFIIVPAAAAADEAGGGAGRSILCPEMSETIAQNM